MSLYVTIAGQRIDVGSTVVAGWRKRRGRVEDFSADMLRAFIRFPDGKRRTFRARLLRLAPL